MAFVGEELKGKDMEYVRSFGFRNPLSIRDEADLPWHWVADRKRKYYLICLGAGGGRSYETEEYPPSYYRLIVEEKVVEIEARYRQEGNGTTGIQLWWRIVSIVVSKGVKLTGEELKEIIKEAFIADSNLWRKNLVTDVTFDCMAEPFFRRK